MGEIDFDDIYYSIDLDEDDNPFISDSEPSKLTLNKDKVGFDFKYKLKSNNTIDIAYNPDFGQIEQDPLYTGIGDRIPPDGHVIIQKLTGGVIDREVHLDPILPGSADGVVLDQVSPAYGRRIIRDVRGQVDAILLDPRDGVSSNDGLHVTYIFEPQNCFSERSRPRQSIA